MRSSFVSRNLMLILAAALCFSASPAVGQETPETSGRHTVREGDTLWDLADRYLRSPFRWNDIFELNPAVVEDPHWIYPGESLRIPGAFAAAGDLNGGVASNGGFPDSSLFRRSRNAGSGRSLLAIDDGPPQPAVSPSDFRRAALLLPESSVGPQGTTVRIHQENPLDLNMAPSASQFSQVVIGLGGLSPSVGDMLKAVRWDRFEEGYGRVMLPQALLRVDRLWSDSARATVVTLFGNYSVEDVVIGVDDYVLDPAARAVDAEHGMTGTIVGFEVSQVLLGIGEMVFLDLGKANDVHLADEFAVFGRDAGEAVNADVTDALIIVRVVHLTEHTATARVTRVRDPGTRPGDSVRLVRRMP